MSQIQDHSDSVMDQKCPRSEQQNGKVCRREWKIRYIIFRLNISTFFGHEGGSKIAVGSQ